MKKNQLPPSEADVLRLWAEKRLQEQLTRPDQPLPTAEETLRLVHELQVHQVELELQNQALLEMRAQLEQRAEKYADLYDFAPLSYFTLTTDGTIEEINLAGAALLGQDRFQLIGRRFGLFVSAATLTTFNAFLAETLISASRKTCEVVIAPEGLPPRFMRLEGLGTVSGRDQQCRLAAIDITERKQAKTAFQREIFIRDVLDSLTAHIAVLDDQGNIVLVNAAWRRFAEQNGGDVNCLVGANYLQVCHHALTDSDNAEARAALSGIRTVISGARPRFNLEYPCHSPDKPRWFVMRVFPLSGPHQGVVVAHEEITEQRRAEEQRRASESRFRTLMELLPYGVQEIDCAGRVTFANPAMEHLYGPSIGRFIWDFLADDAEREPLRDYLQFLVREQPPPTTYFSKDRHANGSIIDCQIDWAYLYDSHNQLQGFLSVITDITDKKRMDDALQESEARFRLLLQETPAIAAQGYSADGTVHYWNKAAETIYGYTAQEAIGKNLLDLIIPPEMRSEVEQAIRQMAATQQNLPMSELSLMHKDGSRVAVLSSHVVIEIPGKGVELFCLDMDISERKKMEQILRQYQYMVSAMPDTVSLLDQNYIYQVVNQEYLRRTGKNYDAIVGHSVAEIMGEEVFQQVLKEKLDRCLAGETVRYQEWFDTVNKGSVFLDVVYSPYCDEQGVCSGIMVSTRDITTVKLAEQAWHASEERYRQLFNSMINGFALHEILYDAEGKPCDYRFLEINPAFEQFTGMYAADLIGRTVREVFPNTESHWIETYGRVTLTGEPLQFDNYFRSIDKWFQVVAYRPRIGQFACLFTDITERRHIEEALNVTLTKYKTLFDSFPLGVTVSDSAGRILESNQMAEHLLGIPKTTLNPRTIDSKEWLIVRPDGSVMPPAEYASVRALKENHIVENMEMGVVMAQDHTVWLSVTAAPLPLEGYGVAITFSDISARKQMEKELHQSLAEKETLLREVHHRVKNNLAAIIGILDLQQSMLTDAPTVSLLADIGSRIKSMALIHEMLYQSDTLSRIDFQGYLQTLIGYLRGSFDPRGAVRFNVAATGVWMSIDTAIPCGLIINELVINALKYAFPLDRPAAGSHRSEIAITVVWEDTGYTLTVADNGVGLPENLDWQTTRTLGLRLVRMLGQHQLQGTLTLDRTAGVRFTLRFSGNSPLKRRAEHDWGNHPDCRG